MGKKINPLIFRSNYKYKKSNWIGNEKTYGQFLKEDFNLRNFIKEFFRANKLKINSVFIFRKQTVIVSDQISIYIIIYLSKSKTKKVFDKIFYLKHLIQKKFYNNNQRIHILISETGQNQFLSERFFNLIQKIQQNGSIKLLVSNFLASLSKLSEIYGAKIIVSGRINGSEKSRVLKESFGIINLQTVSSKIGFLNKVVQTKDGLINVILIYNLK